MADTISVRDFLKARKDRALGAILGHMERTIWHHLGDDEKASVRNTVIDALNLYHDSVLDLMKSENGSERNDEVIALLERLNDSVERRISP